jgi:hypothetical protein
MQKSAAAAAHNLFSADAYSRGFFSNLQRLPLCMRATTSDTLFILLRIRAAARIKALHLIDILTHSSRGVFLIHHFAREQLNAH